MAILGSASDVFGTMFSKRWMKKSEEDRIISIPGCDPIAVLSLLYFVYTGRAVIDADASNSTGVIQSTLQVWTAAHKYHIPALEAKCSAICSANLDRGNVALVMKAAMVFEDKALHLECCELIKNEAGFDERA